MQALLSRPTSPVAELARLPVLKVSKAFVKFVWHEQHVGGLNAAPVHACLPKITFVPLSLIEGFDGNAFAAFAWMTDGIDADQVQWFSDFELFDEQGKSLFH